MSLTSELKQSLAMATSPQRASTAPAGDGQHRLDELLLLLDLPFRCRRRPHFSLPMFLLSSGCGRPSGCLPRSPERLPSPSLVCFLLSVSKIYASKIQRAITICVAQGLVLVRSPHCDLVSVHVCV